ncbi:MAG TPA: haloacid dehalogenase-like hydrolase [Candidatus Acidoferrum sp.]|nr:haloacid dehalogenase-like hydrolase [Candidatus Acidoferrum sp.]
MSGRVAAFFDLDGTLLPLPSLESRFFRMLRYRGEIPLTNYFFWCREALRLLPRGISQVAYANKMYLRGVHSFVEIGSENQIGSRAQRSGQPSQPRASEGEGRPSMPPRRNPRWPVPPFFEDGVERVAWHAMQGHAIVIVSGTLEPLANTAARALETELAARGVAATIRVCATKLEENGGVWTGRVLGEAMFEKAKARATHLLAKEMGVDLSRSCAYGDSAQDRWMLASVGNPAAVNPTPRLARIAWKRGWPVLRTTNRLQQIVGPLLHAGRCA